MTAIEKLILKQKVTAKELEMIIGQLTHVSVIIPLIHHFLSQIQELQKQATNNNWHATSIPEICIDDLTLI